MGRHHFVWASAALLTIAGILSGCQTVHPVSKKQTSGAANTSNSGLNSTSQASSQASTPISVKNGPTSLPIIQQGKLQFQGIKPGVTAAGASSNSTPDFLNATTGFVGYEGGIYMTSDGGTSWQRFGQFSGHVASLSFSSETTGLVLIRSGGDNTDAASQEATYTWTLEQTTDSGASWHSVWSKERTVATGSPAFIGGTITQNGENAYICAASRLWISHDNGKSWSVSNLSGSVRAISAPGTGVLYVVTSTDVTTAKNGRTPQQQAHILKSTDAGRTFQHLLNSKPMNNWQGEFAFDGKKHGVFLVKDWGSFQSTLYTTSDGGLHWNGSKPQAFQGRIMQQNPIFLSPNTIAVALNPGAAPFAGGIAKVALTTGKVTQLTHTNWRSAFLSTDGHNLYATVGFMNGQTATLKSTDEGQNWTPMFPLPTPSVAIDFISSKTGFGLSTVGNQNYILKTTDGGISWRTVKTLPRGVLPENLAFTSAENGYVLVVNQSEGGGNNAATFEQLLVTNDGGTTWSVVAKPSLPSNVSDFLASSPTSMTIGMSYLNGQFHLASGTERGSLIKAITSTEGVDWNLGAVQKTPTASVNTYAYAPDGQLWAAVSSAKPGGNQPYNTTIYAFTPTANSVVNGKQYSAANVIRNSTGQVSNVPAKFQPFWTLPKGWMVLGMDRPSSQSAVVYAQKGIVQPTESAVFQTTDGGKHWTERTSKQVPKPLDLWPSGAAVSLSFISPSTGFMLTADGLVKTTNGGSTWTWVQ